MSKTAWVCITILLIALAGSFGMFYQRPVQTSFHIDEVIIGGSINTTVKNIEIKGEARSLDLISLFIGASMGGR